MQTASVKVAVPMPASRRGGKNAVAPQRAATKVVDVAWGRPVSDRDSPRPARHIARRLAPAAVPRGRVGEEDAQKRSLALVEARVVTDDVELLLSLEPVESRACARAQHSVSLVTTRPPSPENRRGSSWGRAVGRHDALLRTPGRAAKPCGVLGSPAGRAAPVILAADGRTGARA